MKSKLNLKNKLNLMNLNRESEMFRKEMKHLTTLGGSVCNNYSSCSCACAYEGQGGSTTEDNYCANSLCVSTLGFDYKRAIEQIIIY